MPIDNLMTTREAAQKAGLTPRTIQAHIRRGNLKAKKVGRDYFIDPDDFEAWAASNKRGRPPKKKDPEAPLKESL